MAPIRRYLRISKYSVLECRIYVDNPSLAESWLLNSRNPILPRVIESVRPLVLPKLREEQERSKSKSKKKSVKDVVVEVLAEDFEVSIFLTETNTRHSILFKHKHFRDTSKKLIQSNSNKLTGDTNDAPIEVADGPAIAREESEESFNLQDVPPAQDDPDALFISEDEGPRRSKRARVRRESSDSSADFGPLSKRRKDADVLGDGDDDDKKKMAMDTSYDGFAIYGRVLCLVVKKIDRKGKAPAKDAGQAMMEDWIISTQMPAQEEDT
ncbi:Cell cycle negative regulator roughex protein [Rutstroemia sp. NJR-2017a BVV2]|nr:Cell cycle negative regulator roughex protein [Rutstroemia sp. NJR-2017a BVV2]